jgi:hypothetical protein
VRTADRIGPRKYVFEIMPPFVDNYVVIELFGIGARVAEQE